MPLVRVLLANVVFTVLTLAHILKRNLQAAGTGRCDSKQPHGVCVWGNCAHRKCVTCARRLAVLPGQATFTQHGLQQVPMLHRAREVWLHSFTGQVGTGGNAGTHRFATYSRHQMSRNTLYTLVPIAIVKGKEDGRHIFTVARTVMYCEVYLQCLWNAHT